MRFFITSISLLCIHLLYGVEKVTFLTHDGLRVTADLYIQKKTDPFILLFHQANYSRGEYNEVVTRLLKLGYNCLAVDLRTGDQVNFIKNETAEFALKHQKPNSFIDAKEDIEAAIRFIKTYTTYPVILAGSSFSASLSLMVAAENNWVDAVLAFSPGEYFRPEVTVKNEIRQLNKPVFAYASKIESPYVDELLSDLPAEKLTMYKPDGKGVHGAKVLWPGSYNAEDCWFNLMLFLRKVKE